MSKKILAILVAFLFLAGIAAAALPTVDVLNRDGNYYYPSRGSTITISFQVADADDPADVNIIIGYRLITTATLTSITSNNAGDANSNNFCTSPITDANQVCTYDFTPPAGSDANYVFDVNIYDITNGDDLNALSGSVVFDFNACDTIHSISNDVISFTRTCTGYGQDSQGGSERTVYSKNRQGGCADNYSTYTDPFKLALGEITVCYYSTDGLGNTETGLSFVHEASSSAFGLVVLTEVALAAVLLFAILAAFLIFHRDLSAETMIPLVAAAVLMVISIVIFAAII